MIKEMSQKKGGRQWHSKVSSKSMELPRESFSALVPFNIETRLCFVFPDLALSLVVVACDKQVLPGSCLSAVFIEDTQATYYKGK